MTDFHKPVPARLTIIESPFAADTFDQRRKHIAYARAACYHSQSIGEAPFASHLFYTQFLDDKVKTQRNAGINAGLSWADAASHRVFYTDLGWSRGMIAASTHYRHQGVATLERCLPLDIWTEFLAGRFADPFPYAGDQQPPAEAHIISLEKIS